MEVFNSTFHYILRPIPFMHLLLLHFGSLYFSLCELMSDIKTLFC